MFAILLAAAPQADSYSGVNNFPFLPLKIAISRGFRKDLSVATRVS